MKKGIIKLIKKYQQIPFSSHYHCRYTPTCSNYMIDAINEYGTVRGLFMGLFRILRCNPLSKGGYDPVKRRKK